jgi:hypothetical protein
MQKIKITGWCPTDVDPINKSALSKPSFTIDKIKTLAPSEYVCNTHGILKDFWMKDISE